MNRRHLIRASAVLPGIPLLDRKRERAAFAHPTSLNVRHFGAAGDGIHDDSHAVQIALDRAGAGGEVYFPDGQYLLSNPTISRNENIRIRGESWNAELIRAADNTQTVLTVLGAGTLIDMLAVNGNGTSAAGAQFADLNVSAANCQVDRVLIVDSPEIGLSISGDHCIVTASIILGLGNPAVQSFGIWANANNAGVLIHGNYITGSGIDGIGISGNGYQVIGNSITGCHAYSGEGGGQLVVYDDAGLTHDGIISGNTIGPGAGPASCGMELNGSHTTVIGNNISNQQFLGLIATGNGWLINNNVIRNSGQDGSGIGAAITMNAGASNFVISGNRLVDDQATPTQSYGVFIDPGASNQYTIANNIFSGNVGGTINDGGTGFNKVIHGNVGIDDIVPQLAANPSIALPLNPMVILNGTDDVSMINGGSWAGRNIGLFAADGVTFVTGGNIATAMSVPAGTLINGYSDGTNWYLR